MHRTHVPGGWGGVVRYVSFQHTLTLSIVRWQGDFAVVVVVVVCCVQHSKGVTHGNLKPSNIMLMDGRYGVSGLQLKVSAHA